MTLDDLEQRNSPNRSVISPNSVAFGADYVKVVEDTPILSVFSDISLTAILAGDPNGSVKVRHSPIARENFTITRKRCKIGGKLVLITNRKSFMSFRLVLKSVTLNDLERRNSRYIALFQRIW